MAEQTPLRVLVVISNKNAIHWDRSWSATEDILPAALEVLEENNLLNLKHTEKPQTILLAKQRWQTRVFLVFDISNPAYDAALGHLPEHNILPVSIVRLGGKTNAYPASPQIQRKVNRDIAQAHNDNGIDSLPPFVTDYTLGPPFYPNSRDPSLLL